MSNKKFVLKGFHLILILFFQSFSFNSLAIQERIYAPEDLKVPVFDTTGFIIDPDNRIIPEWKNSMLGLRETYFFSTYVEPICVRVDNIRSPKDLNDYADKLIELWDLENKTNGRFVFQISCASKKKIVYRIGSKIKRFYSTVFLNELAADIESIHFDGEATGTGDYVSLQRLGNQVFTNLAFDSEIMTYEGNNGIHTFYPDDIERSYGEIKTMKKSIYRGLTDLNANSENAINDRQNAYVQKNYFNELSQSEIDENFAAFTKEGYFINLTDVPNAREINGGHVTDPHRLLNQFAVDTINNLLKKLEDSLGYQVAVVCANSIGDNDPHSWGTDLFNHWGIGEKETENGLLILLVYDVHAIEFITGRGTEGILTDLDCYDIQQQEMVPYFKKDDYVTGMIRGTQAVCDFFYGSPPIYSSDENSDYSYNYSDEYYDSSFDEYGVSGRNVWIRLYIIFGIIFSISWILMLVIALLNRDLYKRYYMLKFFSLTIWIFIFPIPFLVIYFLTKTLMDRWRNAERFSETTGELMHKLDDNTEDRHLAKGQVSEEKVKSIDYDVWVTDGAKEILILAYKKWFSKYNKCISCKYKTYFQVYDKTISSPTYVSSGTGEKLHRCENCGHSKITTYTIPRKTRSSSGSSGGSSYGSSSGSSSRSGGSSYGGGSSRGGGSGSRW